MDHTPDKTLVTIAGGRPGWWRHYAPTTSLLRHFIGTLFFFLYIFLGFIVYVYIPLPPLRGQHTVLCHPRWRPTSGLTEFAVCWGGAGFEPRTTDLQSGALPLSHLSSSIEPPLLLRATSPPMSHLSSWLYRNTGEPNNQPQNILKYLSRRKVPQKWNSRDVCGSKWYSFIFYADDIHYGWYKKKTFSERWLDEKCDEVLQFLIF